MFVLGQIKLEHPVHAKQTEKKYDIGHIWPLLFVWLKSPLLTLSCPKIIEYTENYMFWALDKYLVKL